MLNSYFKLFASCLPVKGVRRSGICDLQRGTFNTIPNSLYDVLQDCKALSRSEILDKYGEPNREVIIEFFTWLCDKEYGFWCDNLEEFQSFPEMNYEWDSPFEISTMILDIDKNSEVDFASISAQIIEIGIPHIQIRSYSEREIDFYVTLFQLHDVTRVRTIDLITPYYAGAETIDFKKLCRRYLRINSIIFYGAPTESRIAEINGLTRVIFTEQKIDSHKYCGIISPAFFNINKDLAIESMNYNTCLNRKISIDIHGEIKNCPSLTESFGNIKNTSLRKAMEHPDFRKLWSIKKSDIETCKSCEYRLICTDCRAFRENPDDILSKPLKCGYDPATAVWENWSQNPLKQQAINQYGMHSTIHRLD